MIEEYLSKNGEKLDDIIKDKDRFGELLLDLRYKSGKTLREMSEIFRINNDKLNKIINQNSERCKTKAPSLCLSYLDKQSPIYQALQLTPISELDYII